MKIAIIGASGEVGFRLVKKLCNDHQIKCIVRNKNKKDFRNLKNTEVAVVRDVSETTDLTSAIEGSDVIINTGYIWFAKDINNAIKEVDKNPKQIIFTGSTGIFTKLQSNGAQIKRDAEQFIQKNYKIPWTIIRPTMIYGHINDRNISRLTKVINKTPIFPLIGSGNSLIQPVFIDDLLKAFEIAILNEHVFRKSFNIGAEKPISNKQLIFLVSINPKIISLTLKILALLKIRPISQEQILRFQEDKNISLEEFKKSFNFTPISFEKGIESLIIDMKTKNCL
jgi:nucleoside-diphosphate-sugar epimerase